MDNEFDINPYIEFNARANELNVRRKQIDADTFKFHDEFLKVFVPDQTEFDALIQQVKQMMQGNHRQEDVDKVYYKMAMIYKKWIPIEELLYEKNPLYRDLFKGLKFMLQDIEKREHGKSTKKKEEVKPPRPTRAKKTSCAGSEFKRPSASI